MLPYKFIATATDGFRLLGIGVHGL